MRAGRECVWPARGMPNECSKPFRMKIDQTATIEYCFALYIEVCSSFARAEISLPIRNRSSPRNYTENPEISVATGVTVHEWENSNRVFFFSSIEDSIEGHEAHIAARQLNSAPFFRAFVSNSKESANKKDTLTRLTQ